MVGNQFQSRMKCMEHTGMATATDGLRRHQWSMMSPLVRNLHQQPCRRPRLPGVYSSLFLLSRPLFFLNHHHHLALLNRSISLPLPPHLFNSVLAFTTKSLNTRTQCTQVLLVPTHDLLSP